MLVNRPIGIFIMIVAFIVLTIIATINYNSRDNFSSIINNKSWYQPIDDILFKSDKFFSGLLGNDLGSDIKNSNILAGDNLPGELFRYIKIEKQDNSWSFILQNKKRVIFEKTFGNLEFNR